MAEKKSTTRKATPSKRAVKKVEEPKPTSEVQQAIEQVKPLNINWDVIGFSSAALTLLGAGLLFMLGWAYEVNWYSYFGVSMSQVTIQPQNIFIQCIPGLVTLATTIAVSVITLVGFETIKNTIRENTFNKREVFTASDWTQVISFTVFFMLTYLLGYLAIASSKVDGIYLIYEIYYLLFLVLSIGGIIVGLILIFFTESITLVRKIGFAKWKALVTEGKLSVRYPQKTFIFVAFAFILVFESISLSAIYAINDAAKGFRGSGGWQIQPALLVAPEENYFADSIKQTCKNSHCISGPFGLIGENDNNYILIKWKEDHVQYFPYHPGIFIIPKSENTYLIPFTNLPISSPNPQVLPTLTATLAVKPSFTPTIMPTLRPTITPTFTPIPSQP